MHLIGAWIEQPPAKHRYISVKVLTVYLKSNTNNVTRGINQTFVSGTPISALMSYSNLPMCGKSSKTGLCNPKYA